jgi:hypothetical protein
MVGNKQLCGVLTPSALEEHFPTRVAGQEVGHIEHVPVNVDPKIVLGAVPSYLFLRVKLRTTQRARLVHHLELVTGSREKLSRRVIRDDIFRHNRHVVG